MTQSLGTAYAFTINYILGVGILSLPVAVASSGTLISAILYFVISFVSVSFMIALAEITGRGTQFLKWKLWKHKHPDFVDAKEQDFSSSLVEIARTDVGTGDDSHSNLLDSNSDSIDYDNKELLGISEGRDSGDPLRDDNIKESSSFLGNRSNYDDDDDEDNNGGNSDTKSLDGSISELNDGLDEKGEKRKCKCALKWRKKRKEKRSHEELSEYDPDNPPTFLFSDKHVIEITALMHLFCGLPGELIYFISVSGYILCGLWNYACVFIQSILLSVPMAGMTKAGECDWSSGNNDTNWSDNCDGAYYIYAFIYMVLVSCLSCLDMSEQRVIQICLTALRFLAVTIMCITSIIAMYSAPFNPLTYTGSSEGPYYADVPLADFSQFGKIFTMSLFAFLTHHSTPGILSLLGSSRANKSTVLFNMAFFSIAAVYTTLSICVSLYFGTDVNAVATMMWYNYNGKDFSGGTEESPVPLWAKIIGYIVILFPPIDLLSAYPLNAITLGNSIRMFISNKVTEVRQKKGLPVPNMKRRWFVILCRLFVCIVPCTLSMFIRDVEAIIEISGLLAFVIMFFGPTAALLRSRKICKKIWGGYSKKTPFNTWMTKSGLIIALCVFGVVAFIYSVVSFCINGL